MNNEIFLVLSIYFQSSVILYIPMIASKKSHQKILDYNMFSIKKRFEVDTNRYFLVKN